MPPSRGLARYRANGNYRAVSSQWSGCWPNTPAPSAPHRPATNSTYYPPAASDQRTHGLQQSKIMTYQSIQLGADNRPIADDISDHVHPNNVVPDSQKANIHIATRDGSLHTFNSHSGVTEVTPKTTTVQLKAATGLVRVPGTPHEVTPEVLERMKETSPELFLPEAEKAAIAKEAVADAAAEEATRVSDNKFLDEFTEATHLHFNSEIPVDQKISALVSVYRDGALSESQIQQLASGMHIGADEFVGKWNDMAMHLQAQVTVLATRNGVNLPEFSQWMREVRGNEAVKELTQHALNRDVVGAYGKHMSDFLARGNKK